MPAAKTEHRKKAVMIFFACIITAALTACKETPRLPPSENMPRMTTESRTSSTYTGTTVEYIPTSPTAARRNSFDMPDMPDMPEFPDIDMQAADNPFGSEFYAMFGGNGAEYPDFFVSTEDDSGEHLPSSETSVPYSSGGDDISVSREDVPDEAMTRMTEPGTAKVETAFPGFTMPDYTFSYPVETTVPAVSAETVTAVCGTLPQTEGFDIRDYMPSPADFPDFGDIEFDTADRAVR